MQEKSRKGLFFLFSNECLGFRGRWRICHTGTSPLWVERAWWWGGYCSPPEKRGRFLAIGGKSRDSRPQRGLVRSWFGISYLCHFVRLCALCAGGVLHCKRWCRFTRLPLRSSHHPRFACFTSAEPTAPCAERVYTAE